MKHHGYLCPFLRRSRTEVDLRCLIDGFTDARVGATTAYVAVHRGFDVVVARRRDPSEQRGCGHDLAWLTVAALHDVDIEPRLLQPRADRRVANSLNGRHGAVSDMGDLRQAGANGFAVEMDNAGAAKSGAAAELRSFQIDRIAQN